MPNAPTTPKATVETSPDLAETIAARRAESVAAPLRQRQISTALNEWGKGHYGSADAFSRTVADIVGCSVPHVGNVLRGHAPSERVLEVAEDLFLAATGEAVATEQTQPA